MRILIVSTSFMADVPQLKLERMAEIEGAAIGLLAPRVWKPRTLLGHYELCEPKGFVAYPQRVVFPGRNGLYLYHPTRLAGAIREFRPDVVHVEHEPFSLVTSEVAMITRALGLPMTFSAQENTARARHYTRWPGQRYVFRSAAASIPANFGAAALLERRGWAGPMYVIPQLGAEVVDHAPEAPAGRPFKVGYFGRLTEEKGIETLIRAMALLQSCRTSMELELYGSGDDERRLRELSDSLGLQETTKFNGPQSFSVAVEQMREVDAVVLPSQTTRAWREQFGHVLVQAMASGRPTVGSSSGEIPRVVGDPEMIADEGSAQGLATILARLATDPALYERKAIAALRRGRLFSNRRIGAALYVALDEARQAMPYLPGSAKRVALDTRLGARDAVSFYDF